MPPWEGVPRRLVSAGTEVAAVISSGPWLTATYTGEPDQMFEFGAEGQERLFGRDDTLCHIVIWSAINGSELARVAGRIWRRDDELWLRNLSLDHDVHLTVPGMPPEPPLPPRRSDGARGPARSIPAPLCMITAPGGCDIVVRQLHQPAAETFSYGVDQPTAVAVPPVPEDLRPVATALCAPLLRGGQLPATYSEIMQELGERSVKAVRSRVTRLCALYADAIPSLRDRMLERRRREEAELAAPAISATHRGVWGSSSSGADDGDANLRRRRALTLPDYYEVALLLVRHHRVTIEDSAAGSGVTQERRAQSTPA